MNTADYKLQIFNYAKELVEKNGKTFVFDAELKRLYNLFFLYFTGNKEFENYFFENQNKEKIYFSLKKGLFLTGTNGRSKTFLFDSVFKFFTEIYFPEKTFKTTHAYTIQKDFIDNGANAIYSKIYFNQEKANNAKENPHYHLYIDEIGVEKHEVKNFYNLHNPIVELIDRRFFLHEKRQIITHATSNLNMKNIRDKYGDRTYSRFFGLFNIITTEGPDLRIEKK